MKKTALFLATSALALVGFTSVAEAGPRIHFSTSFGGNHAFTPRTHVPQYQGHQSHSSHVSHGYRNPHVSQGFQHGGSNRGHCSAPYIVRTCEINRQQQCYTAYKPCGQPYQVHITVVTYRDQYSNGMCRTYTRVIY